MNTTVSILIRFGKGKDRKTVPAAYAGKARLKPGMGRDKKGREFLCPGGVYWLRWYVGANQKWERIGEDPNDALVAQMRQEAVLAGERPPVERPSPDKRPTLAGTITAFLLERSTSQDTKACNDWERELNLFAKTIGTVYLADVTSADVTRFWQYLKDEDYSERTIYNRIQSIVTFFRTHGITGLVKKMPKFTKKLVDYYKEGELEKFFAACDEEERIRYQVFLYTGLREQEVMYLNWTDFNLDEATVTVREKDSFTVKNRTERTIPIPHPLVEALKTYKTLYPNRKTIFVNRDGNPDGHMLRKVKIIARRAGLQGNWTLHRFRRTFATRNLEAGTPIHRVKAWLGHSDFTTLMRYVAELEAKDKNAQTFVSNTVLPSQRDREEEVGVTAAPREPGR